MLPTGGICQTCQRNSSTSGCAMAGVFFFFASGKIATRKIDSYTKIKDRSTMRKNLQKHYTKDFSLFLLSCSFRFPIFSLTAILHFENTKKSLTAILYFQSGNYFSRCENYSKSSSLVSDSLSQYLGISGLQLRQVLPILFSRPM